MQVSACSVFFHFARSTQRLLPFPWDSLSLEMAVIWFLGGSCWFVFRSLLAYYVHIWYKKA